ncbi:MAG: hypothetical protein AB8B63_22435 [Granulosicoccus sp.]
MSMQTDVVILSSGPAGLFQIFEPGLIGIPAPVIEVLAKPGGQLSELCLAVLADSHWLN